MVKQYLPDLEALEALAAVSERGSFTAAARALGLSKVTLSRRVVALEEALGDRLLVRTTRSVHLTPAGEIAVTLGAGVLEQARELVRAVADANRDPSGQLRIVTTPLMHDIVLEPVVIPFVKRYPKVTVVLEVHSDPLASGLERYDLALLVGPPRGSSLGSLLLGRSRLGCFASADYLDKHGALTSPGELAAHRLIAVGGGQPAWDFTRGERALSVPVRPRLTVATHELALRAAAKGAGIARLPLFLVARAPAGSALVRVLEGWTLPEVPAYAIFPSRERPPPHVRAFLDLLKERLRPGRKRG